MSRAFSSRVDLLDTRGDHLRYIPAAVAEALVAAEHAAISAGNGRVRAIRLTVTAATSAARIGEPFKPTGPTSVRFVRRERLDTGTVWTFARRSTETLE